MKDDDDGRFDQDERFSAAVRRPQFRPKSKSSRKAGSGSGEDVNDKDERFDALATDPRFVRVVGDVVEKGGVDRYGRTQRDISSQTKKAKKRKKNQSKESPVGEEYQLKPSFKSDTLVEKVPPTETEEEKDNIPVKEDPASRLAYLNALSRGEIDVDDSSSSSEDNEKDDDGSFSSSSSSDEESSSTEEEEVRGILDPAFCDKNEVAYTQEESPYLAIMNLDWEHVRAVDIFAVLSSFSPSPGSSLRWVKVFLSDFGRQRLEKEELTGPPRDIWKDSSSENFDETYRSMMEEEEEANGTATETTTTDYDVEKLRAYEASKLRYYFAVAEFSSADEADAVYREVDGMDLGNFYTGASFDLRVLGNDQLEDINKKTPKETCLKLPSTYEPPAFVKSALASMNQTSVECTWEDGDKERDDLLTAHAFGVKREKWDAMVEGDDLKAYLASDVSSDDGDNDSVVGDGNDKTVAMRRLLGLEDESDKNLEKEESSDGDGEESTDPHDNHVHLKDDDEGGKELSYIPDVETKVRDKKDSDRNPKKPLTEIEKYLEKRRERRKRKKQKDEKGNSDAEGYGLTKDDFFVDEENDLSSGKEKNRPSTKEELELLMAGDDEEELARDYDMKKVQKMEKLKDDLLKGKRKGKRKRQAQKALESMGISLTTTTSASSQTFALDTQDQRFRAILDGDEKFGIDRQHPSYTATPSMAHLLAAQSERRRARGNTKTRTDPDDTQEPQPPSISKQNGDNYGDAILDSTVQRLKQKLSKKKQKQAKIHKAR